MYMTFTVAVVLVAAVIFPLILFVASKNASHGASSRPHRRKRQQKSQRQPTHLVVVLGSGGHTEEMLSVLRRAQLDFKHQYTRRTYIVSSGDGFSARKAAEFEQEASQSQHYSDDSQSKSSGTQYDSGLREDAPSSSASSTSSPLPSYAIVTIPRARKVHQSFLTAPLSTLNCLWSCLRILQGRITDEDLTSTSQAHDHDPSTPNSATTRTADYPGIILTNGPGTAVCIIAAARILRALNTIVPRACLPWLGIRPQSGSATTGTDRYLRTIFIESWARVSTLSLSGKIVLPLADRFLVQWEGLQGRKSLLGGRTEYAGTLIG